MTRDKMICDGEVGCGKTFEMPDVEAIELDGGVKRLYFECPHCKIKRPLGWRSPITSKAGEEAEADATLFQSGQLSYARLIGRWDRRDKDLKVHYSDLITKYKNDDRLRDIT